MRLYSNDKQKINYDELQVRDIIYYNLDDFDVVRNHSVPYIVADKNDEEIKLAELRFGYLNHDILFDTPYTLYKEDFLEENEYMKYTEFPVYETRIAKMNEKAEFLLDGDYKTYENHLKDIRYLSKEAIEQLANLSIFFGEPEKYQELIAEKESLEYANEIINVGEIKKCILEGQYTVESTTYGDYTLEIYNEKNSNELIIHLDDFSEMNQATFTINKKDFFRMTNDDFIKYINEGLYYNLEPIGQDDIERD